MSMRPSDSETRLSCGSDLFVCGSRMKSPAGTLDGRAFQVLHLQNSAKMDR